MNLKRRFGILIFTVSILVSILACSGGAATVTPTQPPPTQPPPTVAPAPTNTPPPPPTETLPPPPTETSIPPSETPVSGDTGSTPGQLNISSLNGYQDEFDDWHIVGLISNDTERAVNDLEIEVEFFDANDNSLYKEIAYSSLYNITPGEVSTFDLWVYDDIPTADHYTATIVGQGAADIERAAVDIINAIKTVDDYDDISLTGEVVNNTDSPVEINGLSAAIFNNDGELVTTGYVSVVRHYLEPGESGPFRVSLYGIPEDQANSLGEYKFYTDSIVADPSDVYDLALSDDHLDYLDAYGNFHLVGTVTNNSDTRLNVSLIAGIYDGDGNCLDASSRSLPVYSLAPGETIAYDFDSWGPMNYAEGTYDKATQFKVMIDWYWTWDTTTELVDLVTQDDSNTFDDYQGKFIGYVVNNSGKDLTGGTIIVALYDKTSGQLVGTNYSWIFDDIANGATAAYEVNIYIPEGFDPTTIEYVITAKGELP